LPLVIRDFLVTVDPHNKVIPLFSRFFKELNMPSMEQITHDIDIDTNRLGVSKSTYTNK
jgi:hypothetical protein